MCKESNCCINNYCAPIHTVRSLTAMVTFYSAFFSPTPTFSRGGGTGREGRRDNGRWQGQEEAECGEGGGRIMEGGLRQEEAAGG